MSTYNGSGLVYDQSNLTFDGNPAGLANMPVMGVFIAFDDGPYVADPDWVEVTNYVRDINIRRGRQDDLQQFPSGSCSLTLDNRARLFDPFNTAGAYYGKLKPRRQIKIVGQWAGVNYDLFRGFVAGWPVEYSVGGKDSTVSIDCFDLLGLITNETVPADWIDYYTRSLNPVRYFRANEGVNAGTTSVTFRESISNALSIQCFRVAEVDKLAEGIQSRAVYTLSGSGGQSSTPTVNALSFSFWSQGTASGDSVQIYLSQVNYGGVSLSLLFPLNVSLGSPITITANNGTTRYTGSVNFPENYNYYLPTHWVIVFNRSTNTLGAYANGQVVSLSVTSAAFALAPQELYAFQRVAVQEISVYDRFLSADEASNLYSVATGRIPESSTARIQRLIDTTEIPDALLSLTAFPVATVSKLGNSAGVVPELGVITSSEDSDLFISKSGVLTFRARNDWASNPRSNTSQVTFTDTGTGVYYDYQRIAVDLNADRIRNDSSVQFSGNGVVTSVDQVSVEEFGAAAETVNTYLSTVEQAETLADYRVAIYSQPKIEVEPFLVKGQRNPSYDWPRLLNLELLDRFTFVRTPSVGSAIQKDMLLQSIEHRITPGTWETIINGSARYTGWFILGVSLLGSTEDVLL